MHRKICGLLIYCICILGFGAHTHALTHYTSEYEYGNGGGGGAVVQEQIQIQTDTLDDDWRELFLTGAVFEPYTFANDVAGGIQANTGNSFLDMAYSGTSVRVERIIDDGNGFLGTICASNSNPRIDFAGDMQDSAPKPFSLKDTGFWNEPSGCSTSTRNAILFTLPDDIDGFGVWLGDVESRSDGSGTPAVVEYYDSIGTLLGSFDIGPAVGVDQSICGGAGASTSASACGNETTRFVGFRNDNSQEIRYMKIVVGDDDLDGSTVDGNNEHLSFVGPIVSFEPQTADIELTKAGSSVTVMSGDIYTYMLEVTNYGPRVAQDVTIYESFPIGFTLIESSVSLMTGSTSSWFVGDILSGSTQELILTGTLVGMTGDVLNTAWATASNESGPQTNTGSFVTTIVCHQDTGMVCSGTANSCGETIQGMIGCDGLCDADPMQEDATLGNSCNTGIGACEAVGIIVCNPSGIGVVCNAFAGEPAAADLSCNSIDDDCDGSIDEDYIPVSTSCGIGVCGAVGVTSCAGGEVVDSCEAGSPAVDDGICDGLDNDCDGSTDEDFIIIATSCGVGACQSSGTLACIAGETINSCVGGVAGIDTVCNGIDDDCDGSIDEDYLSIETSCGVGECGAQGVTSCAGGEIVDSCEAGVPAIDDTICDGLDDDCDGSIDEDYLSIETSCGVGECLSSGTTSCIVGEIVDSCMSFLPSTEICDQLDNNCDGIIDEGEVCEEPEVIIPSIIPSIRTTQSGGNNYCGDGLVKNGEQCDDGNFVDDDMCRNDCTYSLKSILKNQEIEILTPVEEIIVENILSIKKVYIEDDIYIKDSHFSEIFLQKSLLLPKFLPSTGSVI